MLTPIIAMVYGLCRDWSQTLMVSAGYLFSGWMFGPDLDTQSVQYKRWGWLRFIWWPYQRWGGHRSFRTQSHDSLMGPLLRIVYLLMIVIIFVFLIGSWLHPPIASKVINFARQMLAQADDKSLKYIILLFLGTWIGSLVHTLTDWLAAWGGSKR